MKLNKVFRYSALAAAVIASSVQAADPGVTKTVPAFGSSSAVYAGGATINNGASFLSTLPAGQPIDLVSQVTIAPGDVGETGDLLVVEQVPGQPGGGFFQLTPDGLETLPAQDFLSLSITPYFTGTLGQNAEIEISDLGGELGIDLAGTQKIKIATAYAIGGQIQSYSKPVKFNVADAPSDAACPDGTTLDDSVVIGDKQLCVLEGTYTEDVHLTSAFDYQLKGVVKIGDDNSVNNSLVIDPGVTLYGATANSFLWIDRGAQIWANGTSSAPITMTSGSDPIATASTRGEWGGLVINGNAPINGCSESATICEAEGEGNSGKFGGDDPEDNSGNLTYVRVKYAGQIINDLDELNGIAFQGVGSGTNVDYIQVHNNQDDGVEFFGGTVNAKHIYLTGNGDDSLDWTKGWVGNVQHVVIVQGQDTGDQGFEMDNNGDAPDSEPRSIPTISNVTIVGNDNTDIGMLIREGTGGNFYNFVITGFGDACIDIDTAETFTAAGTPDDLTGTLTMNNSVVDCNLNFEDDTVENNEAWAAEAWFSAQDGNIELDTGMTDYLNSDAVNALDAFDSESLGNFFDDAEYVGAVNESVSIGLFYKEFETPIEAIIEPGAANQRTFINAQNASIQGIEFDGFRWLDFIHDDWVNWFVAANLTLIDSEVTISPQDAGLVTNPTRALQGQADYIFNVQLGFDDNYRNKGSLVYHITGDKIREVGILGQPDVYDEAYGELDFTYTRYLNDNWTVSLKAKNLLNQMRETTQGGLDVNSLFEGRNASLGVEYVF